MKNLLNKELKLSTPVLTYIFLAFTLMTFLPGYPILCGAFFVCFGLFQSYQNGREANDIMYSVLLPIRKRDVVRAKYMMAVTVQLTAFVLCAAFTAVRMTVLAEAGPYVHNVLMAANPVFLAFVLIIFAVFNTVFIGGFFKTAYKFGRPFILFIVINFIVIGMAETLHHLPGMGFLNDINGERMMIQYIILIAAALVYAASAFASCRTAEKRFEKLDL